MELRVSNQPFREAFQRSDLTIAEVAEHMGWTRNKQGCKTRQPDCTTAYRRLGLKVTTGGKGGTTFVSTLRESEALKMMELFPSLDPVDVGL